MCVAAGPKCVKENLIFAKVKSGPFSDTSAVKAAFSSGKVAFFTLETKEFLVAPLN